jgi:hypothetical protein
MEKYAKNEQDEITHVENKERKKEKNTLKTKKMTKHIQKIMLEKINARSLLQT